MLENVPLLLIPSKRFTIDRKSSGNPLLIQSKGGILYNVSSGLNVGPIIAFLNLWKSDKRRNAGFEYAVSK